jgi:cytochrome P450
MQQVDELIGGMIAGAAARPEIEIVRQFALPLQSRALAFLLNVPQSDAEEWISWGIHVFRDGPNGEAKGQILERYIHRQLDRTLANPGDDFYSALHRAEFRGRKLTREEQVGFVNLTFAGGRDTIIQTVASLIHHLAAAPEIFARLKAEPELHAPAVEEFFRLLSPLTLTARVCPADTDVKGHLVPADERVALCWASANRDETVFPQPDEVQLDRKPNPHIAFGSGPHTCIGAHHARLVARTLLRQLCRQIERIEVIASEAHVEREQTYERTVGFASLTVRLHPTPSEG